MAGRRIYGGLRTCPIVKKAEARETLTGKVTQDEYFRNILK